MDEETTNNLIMIDTTELTLEEHLAYREETRGEGAHYVDIAKACHEANRIYCKSIDDDSQLPWDLAPEWQKLSAIKGVLYHLGHPDSTPADSHESWMKEKVDDGWTYGPIKDPEVKQHPCIVSYQDLPKAQRFKDHLFLAIVRALQVA